MKKTYSETELRDKAKKVFAEYTNAKVAFATPDGNIFLEENRARLHSGVGGTVYRIDKEIESPAADAEAETKEPAREYEKNAVNTIKDIMACQTLEELEKFKSDDRKTVESAVAKRTAELSAPTQEDDTDADKGTGLTDKEPQAPAAETTNADTGTNPTE